MTSNTVVRVFHGGVDNTPSTWMMAWVKEWEPTSAAAPTVPGSNPVAVNGRCDSLPHLVEGLRHGLARVEEQQRVGVHLLEEVQQRGRVEG